MLCRRYPQALRYDVRQNPHIKHKVRRSKSMLLEVVSALASCTTVSSKLTKHTKQLATAAPKEHRVGVVIVLVSPLLPLG